MQLFYCPEILQNQHFLSLEESKHAIKVLRKKNGDSIHIIDGMGGLYHAEIIEPSHKKCGFRLIESKVNFDHKDYYLHIAIAPTKNMNRLEWFVEKAVEIGIDEITPIICSNSERKELKNERLFKTALSATKQSLKSKLPKINQSLSIEEFLDIPISGTKYIAHCENGNEIFLNKNDKNNDQFVILIGPEGDFSSDEINLAKAKGFQDLSFGKSRLRTETAGIVACSQVQNIFL